MLLQLAQPAQISESNTYCRLISSQTNWETGDSIFVLQFGVAVLSDGQLASWTPSAYLPDIQLEISIVTGSWSAGSAAGSLASGDLATLQSAMAAVQTQLALLGPWAVANLASVNTVFAGATGVAGA
jgi:hypothetical protein